jgi:hypothetical protein
LGVNSLKINQFNFALLMPTTLACLSVQFG